ncbi:MAG TPA: alpha-amylase [Candidatus Alistipes merdavium]|nr:alpha-amylase [Candidatus Alistipes merdavium]
MKRFFYLLLTLLFAAAVSCSKDSTSGQEGGLLSVTPSALEFDTGGGSELIELKTDAGSWSLTQSDGTAWCTPERTSGRTSTSFHITVTSNAGGTERSTTLTFTAPGCEEVALTVRQAGDTPAGSEAVVAEPDPWDGVKRADISYQVLVYSFADGDGDTKGDLKGLTERLDYLDEMGVSAVWLSPIHPSSSYHGYDVLDYEAVNPTFGTDADLQAFIDAAHARGIRVYLDYVLNHTGKEHPWFRDAVSSEQSPYRDYYVFSKDPQGDIAAGRIDQIATEGAAGYDAGQWFSTDSNAGATGRFRFELDWSNASAPTVTVTETTDAPDAENTDTSAGGKYLYYGDQQMARFYTEDDTHYHLTLDFDSDWGFLIRTSTTSWDGGTKFGAPDSQTILELGVPFTLTSASTAANIQFSLPTMYHSHFWTAAFADLNYGKASEADASAAFKAVTEAADKWVGMGVDGFRLDAVKHIYHNAYNDENPTFLKKFYDRMNESYHARGGEGDFYMVGEMLDDAANVAPYYKGLPALFEFSFWYRLRWALQNGIGRYFVKDILEYQPAYRQYRADYIEATKLSNHDEDRAASELGRVEGRLRVACAVLLTAQGEPYIYQGEELGYWGTKSNGDEYVRTPILWDRAGRELASGSLSGKVDRQMLTESISVEAQAGEENSLLNLYRTFARLRNTYPALAEGAMTKHPVYNENNADGEAVAVWYREKEGERMFVAHNFGDQTRTLTLDDHLGKAVGLSGEATIKRNDNGTLLTLGAYSSVVFTL